MVEVEEREILEEDSKIVLSKQEVQARLILILSISAIFVSLMMTFWVSG